MATVELTKDNFEQTVNGNPIVIVDFSAPWCGPCRGFAPVFEKAADAHTDVVFAKVNTDEQQELAGAFGIRSIPTLMVFREKVIVFQQAGAQYGVNPSLLAAVASQESGFNPGAVSPAGAVGLMQFMPSTARGLGVNPLDPASSINGAAKYLSGLQNQFGSTALALAAYNAGPGAVSRYGGIPPYAETQNYVRAVTSKAEAYS